jgi:hypothetical protein
MPRGASTRIALGVLAGAALSAIGLLSAGLLGPVAASASTGGFSRAVQVSPPAYASSNPGADLYGVSCTSAGLCTAVGDYNDSAHRQQALAAAATGSKWARGTEVSSPRNASSNPNAALNGVSCPSAGDCTAVGDYRDKFNTVHAMAATENRGKWGSATELSAPAPAALNSVACTSAGNCVAVGSYGGLDHAMVVTETSGKWGGAVEVSLPANAATGSAAFAFLHAVSCPSKGNCVAVGLYGDSSGNRYALIAAESAGTWAPAVAFSLLPAGASNAWAGLLGVSCTAASRCTAVGSYQDSSGERWPMVATETGGKWARAAGSTLPVGANTGSPGPSAEMDAVSCTSVGNCAAFGAYSDRSSYAHDMVVIEAAGKWARAAQLLPPAGASGETVSFGGAGNSVACAKDSCTAVGGYGTRSGRGQATAAAGTI